EPELELAFFSERLLAFGVDLALAVCGYFLSMKVVFPHDGLWANPHVLPWTGLWTGIFVAYEAYANADGRASWGKSFVGIRVADLEGRPLDLRRSALRSALYLVSSLTYAGFLYALFDPRVQAVHDKLAKTLVVQEEPHAGRPWVVGAAWSVAAILFAHWVWVFVVGDVYYRVKTVANAYNGLRSVATLERQY